MNEEQLERAVYLKQNIDTVKSQLKDIENRSFGFGTSFRDIDNVLRPVAKEYLESKLRILKNELDKF